MNPFIFQLMTRAAIANTNPGQLFKKIMDDVSTWLLAGIGVYAAVQFILGCMDFMSKEPQKHSMGKDHMIRACIGLIGAFAAATIMAYLETQAKSWVAIVHQTFIMMGMYFPR